MADGYTDQFGYPLTAAQAAARLRSPRSSGYFDANGVWRKKRRQLHPVTGAAADLDEVDEGYLSAVRLKPRAIGTSSGQVPLAVANRLVAAGLATLH